MGNLPWAFPTLTRCDNVCQDGTGGHKGGNTHSGKRYRLANSAEQGPGADAFQRPLRFRFQARLRPSVEAVEKPAHSATPAR